MLDRDLVEVGEEKRGGSAHILVVEEQPFIRRILEVNLQQAGYRVTSVDRIPAARLVIGKDRPDVVILDIWFPVHKNAGPRDRINGFDFSRELREDPATADLPVILTPTKTADGDLYRNETLPGLKREGRPHLFKPFNPIELLLMVKEVLGCDDPPEPTWGSRI